MDMSICKDDLKKGRFWSTAGMYASSGQDKPFVNEMAYMMVTLHRTGA